LAVIGAGPAGLYAAREASRLGLDVVVYEKRAVGDSVHCAEGFFDMLKLLDPPSAGVRYKVFSILFTAKDTFQVDCSNLNVWMLDRAEWQKSLANELRSAKCTINEHTPVDSALYRKLEQEFDWIIDASGVSAFSIKTARVSPVKRAFTAQYTLNGDFSALYGNLKAVTEPDYCGYYWVFPKTRDIANVGIGWFNKKPNKKLSIHAELVRILQKEGFQDYRILKKSGGPIPVRVADKITEGKMLLAGDAAGLASPLHGGGVDTACISGILAARAIALGKPELYEESLRKVVGTKQALEQKVLDVWQKLDFDELNELLDIAFGNGLSRYFHLWKHRKVLLRESAILRYFAKGHINADWQGGLSPKDLKKF
jgi:digeranylgeranylglycerophospholipid reductase